MNILVPVEAIYNFMDLGFFAETLANATQKKFEMGLGPFLKHLVLGRGYEELTPPALDRILGTARSRDPLDQPGGVRMIDLRDVDRYENAHIPGSISRPFEDFLKDILMIGQYSEEKDTLFILICDTGHQSRVAASILVEEGFSQVASLKRGMRRWRRWKDLTGCCRTAPA